MHERKSCRKGGAFIYELWHPELSEQVMCGRERGLFVTSPRIELSAAKLMWESYSRGDWRNLKLKTIKLSHKMPALICWFTFLWLGLAFKYFTWQSCNSNNCLKLQWIHGSSHELPQMALWCIQFTIFSALIQPVNVALLSRLIIAKLSDLIFLQDSSSHSRLPAGFKEEAEWMERSAFYPDLGMSAIRPMKTPHFKLLLFTVVIIT